METRQRVFRPGTLPYRMPLCALGVLPSIAEPHRRSQSPMAAGRRADRSTPSSRERRTPDSLPLPPLETCATCAGLFAPGRSAKCADPQERAGRALSATRMRH